MGTKNTKAQRSSRAHTVAFVGHRPHLRRWCCWQRGCRRGGQSGRCDRRGSRRLRSSALALPYLRFLFCACRIDVGTEGCVECGSGWAENLAQRIQIVDGRAALGHAVLCNVEHLEAGHTRDRGGPQRHVQIILFAAGALSNPRFFLFDANAGVFGSLEYGLDRALSICW